ncbi:MAG: NADPH-dependent FMN reductase [Chlorobiaceae bacterium]|nr:NADPH-dependent FMN reductase [Chlorobiaceae bacterium]
MKILILDGSPAGDTMGARVAETLSALLSAGGHQTEHVLLRESRIAPCNGCFQCWLKTPGMCTIDDDNRGLVAKHIRSDLVIALTPVTFGAFSPELKKFADHLIQTISPFFCRVNGETHHRQRYDRYPGFVSIGWLPGPDETQEGLFRHLFYRNTINFYTEKDACGILYSSMDNEAIKKNLAAILSSAEGGKSASPVTEAPRVEVSPSASGPVRSALLLVGSPRMAKSTSASLGGYLFEKLAEQGVRTETVQIYKTFGNPEKMASLLESVDRSELVVLAFPLYIDSIPAPVLSVLRAIGQHRRWQARSGKFAAVANSGFIESHHNENALASCAVFAKEAGFSWMGSVAIGGGEGLVHGKPFSELGGPAIPYRKNLDLVAQALASGKSVPVEARMQLGKPFTPGWIYRAVGSYGWKKQARRNGVLSQIDARPYAEEV